MRQGDTQVKSCPQLSDMSWISKRPSTVLAAAAAAGGEVRREDPPVISGGTIDRSENRRVGTMSIVLQLHEDGL